MFPFFASSFWVYSFLHALHLRISLQFAIMYFIAFGLIALERHHSIVPPNMPSTSQNQGSERLRFIWDDENGGSDPVCIRFDGENELEI